MNTHVLSKYQTAAIIAQLSEIERFATQMVTLNSDAAREMCRGYVFERTRQVRAALLGVALTNIEVEVPAMDVLA